MQTMPFKFALTKSGWDRVTSLWFKPNLILDRQLEIPQKNIIDQYLVTCSG